MLYTDTEARTKECPFRSTKNQTVYCTGSNCIAWVWLHSGEDRHAPHGPIDPEEIGYCGELNSQ